jgi:hypothetical protein
MKLFAYLLSLAFLITSVFSAGIVIPPPGYTTKAGSNFRFTLDPGPLVKIYTYGPTRVGLQKAG